MKRFGLLMVLTMFIAFNSMGQQIKWVTFEEALALQKKNPKKIMMDVYTNWCGPCKMLDRNTFQNPDVAKYVNDNYYAVKFDAEGNEVINYKGNSYANKGYKAEMASRRNSVHDLTHALQVNAYPTIVFFDENGDMIFPVRGYQNPQQLELYLKMFQNDKHKEMKTQEDFNTYYSAFKPEFKG
ncbi:thioredoxin-related protein [Gelidibacter algens]|jgi:thioredoxin-related protein|uniref:Thioredoxin-related protein n=1 Tax=Gelidibacter algens TaxID=49280 RepID=A0A1A7R0A7_9FLAO|nr:thioredoxin fold domain-containing protein [Gelidibacter algens]OBX24212.1 thioredoxin [Gelidibacter algens]RAJ22710.1 thioredoxin-related protein [Gelidibacter algens]